MLIKSISVFRSAHIMIELFRSGSGTTRPQLWNLRSGLARRLLALTAHAAPGTEETGSRCGTLDQRCL